MFTKILLGLVIASAGSQADIKAPAWANQKIDRMKREGTLVSYPNTFRSNQNRYEQAVAVYAAYASAVAAGKNSPRDAARFGVDFFTDSLLLIDEFEKELISLGADPKAMRLDIRARCHEALEKRPLEWTKPLFARMKRIGLLVGYPDGMHQTYAPTRYELAVATHATAEHLADIMKGREAAGLKLDEAFRDDFLQIWHDLGRLLLEFRAELFFLTIDHYSVFATELLRLRADSRNIYFKMFPVTFPDVPSDHWAAGAVQHLADEGLLRGYPDRKFKG